MTAPQPPSVPPFQVPPDLQATYANLVRISHSPAEMVLDFAHFLPGDVTSRVCARVVMTPLSAKLLLNALHENLARFEASFGEIHVPGDGSLAGDLFRGIKPPNPPAES